MSENWIEQEKGRVAAETKAKQQEIDNAQFKREKLLRDAAEIYSNFLAVFEKDVMDFNAQFPEVDKRLGRIEFLGSGRNQIQVLRAYPPAYNLKVVFDDTKPSLRYTVSVPSEKAGLIDNVSFEFEFRLSNALKTHLISGISWISVEEISQRMLKPAISGKITYV